MGKNKTEGTVIPPDWVAVFGAEVYSDFYDVEKTDNEAQEKLREQLSKEWENPRVLYSYLSTFQEYVASSLYEFRAGKIEINKENLEKIYPNLLDAACAYPHEENQSVLSAIENDKQLLSKKTGNGRHLNFEEQQRTDNFIQYFATVFKMQFDQASSYLTKISSLKQNYTDICDRVTDVWGEITGSCTESPEEKDAYRKYQKAMLSIDELPNYEPNPLGV